jgi:CRP/FNR family transcriptional regulator
MQNEQITYAYILKQGLIKTYTISEDGDEDIIGFHYPGDIIALDNLHLEKYSYFAEISADSIVCQVNKNVIYDKLNISNYLSSQLIIKQDLLRVLSKCSVKEKVSLFLINHSLKLGVLGYPLVNFNLGFKRSDITNYLGITIETMSRALTELKRLGIIDNRGSYITILKQNELESNCSALSMNIFKKKSSYISTVFIEPINRDIT